MNEFALLMEMASGKPIPAPDDPGAARSRALAEATLGALALAALWGFAVGSRDLQLATANLYKVPMVLLLSVLGAAPAGIVAWKLSGTECRGGDFVLAVASGMLGGTLVLGVLTPVIALYYHSSMWAGPVLAQASAVLAIVVGVAVFGKAVLSRLSASASRARVAIPVLAFAVVQLRDHASAHRDGLAAPARADLVWQWRGSVARHDPVRGARPWPHACSG